MPRIATKRKTTRKAATKRGRPAKSTAKRGRPAKASAKRGRPARTTAKRRAPAKRASAKRRPAARGRAAAAAKTAVKPMAKTAVSSAFSKAQIMATISEETGVSKRDVKAVFESLSNLAHRHLRKRAAGEMTLPGMAKIRVVRKPATKARKGINPFTGEPTIFKAKPARNVVKLRALKALKDMAN